jgi:hypothetical protein
MYMEMLENHESFVGSPIDTTLECYGHRFIYRHQLFIRSSTESIVASQYNAIFRIPRQIGAHPTVSSAYEWMFFQGAFTIENWIITALVLVFVIIWVCAIVRRK